MALAMARVARAGLRRSGMPGVASASASASSMFGRICYRPSIRFSDEPFKKIEDHFNGWTAEELTWARLIIDDKMEKKGLAVIVTKRDARTEAFFHIMAKHIAQQDSNLTRLINKRRDIGAINIGKNGTLNIFSVLTLLLKVEEMWPVIPVIQAWIQKLLQG